MWSSENGHVPFHWAIPKSAYQPDPVGETLCREGLGCLVNGPANNVVVIDYLGQDIKISARVIRSHVLHNHALYCSIKLLNLPIAAGLIWEAGNMLDMEVVKQLLHAGIGEITTVSTLQHLGGMLLEKRPKHVFLALSLFSSELLVRARHTWRSNQ